MIKRQLFLTLFLTLFAASSLVTTALADGKGFYPNGETKWEYLFQNGE
ncbi:MAG: hypothetical protein JRC99_12225, partial [Deltaproteobacteria bacterium]|nr:hypothetical protein [Deltaproteobacteria bacterium]